MKNIKIKLSIIFILFFTNNVSFAEGTTNGCQIENGPAPILQEYLNNVSTITRNINNQIKNKNTSPKSLEKIKSAGLRFWNSMINWDGYFTSFKYYVYLPLTSEVPYQITRDYKLIERNVDSLNSYYDNLVSNGYDNVVINNVCGGIDLKSCNLSGKASDIVASLLDNTQKILQLYTLSILNEKENLNTNLILVPNNFQEEFGKYYNNFTIKDCSQLNGGFFDRVKKAINTIAENGIFSKNAVKEWKDGRALLVGTKSDQEYFDRERQILERELAIQGVSSNSADSMLGNLKRYNEKGLSVDNNFITNSFGGVYRGLKTQVDVFSNSILQTLKRSEKLFGTPGNTTNDQLIGIQNIPEQGNKINLTEDIRKDIDELYNLELPFSQEQDQDNTELMGRIIKMHINLSQASNTLTKATPYAEKVCNEQDKGNGKCSYK